MEPQANYDGTTYSFKESLKGFLGWLLIVWVAMFALLVASNAIAQEIATSVVAVDPTSWDALKELLMQKVLPPLIEIIGVALLLLFAFLKTKAGKALTEKVDNEAISSALRYTTNIAFEIVSAALQTGGDELKKNLADGKITDEECKEGLAKIKEASLKKLQEATIGRLLSSGAAESIEKAKELTDDLLESAVKKTKIVGAVPEGAKKVNP